MCQIEQTSYVPSNGRQEIVFERPYYCSKSVNKSLCSKVEYIQKESRARKHNSKTQTSLEQRFTERKQTSSTPEISSSAYLSASEHYLTAGSDRYYTAPSDYPSSGTQRRPKIHQKKSTITEYTKLLESKNLWPVDPDTEQNWSGRGQHAEFEKGESKLINSILQVEELLGSTGTAIVQSVQCKRILLARKLIKCNRNMTREMAVDEVAHLNRLSHAHVVRIVGTYVVGQELAILLYPVAEWNLEAFLLDIRQPADDGGLLANQSTDKRRALPQFIICLSKALAYLHENMTKHMDIKPKNVLVKKSVAKGAAKDDIKYIVYIADFGIARSYSSIDATETEGPTMFTKRYAAPEVVDRGKRGLSADVFSMGCVFAEIVATLAGSFGPDREIRVSFPDGERQPTSLVADAQPEGYVELLYRLLESHPYGDMSYQANLDILHPFLRHLGSDGRTVEFSPSARDHFRLDEYTGLIERMTLVDPAGRPTAENLAQRNCMAPCCTSPCCVAGPEPLVRVEQPPDPSLPPVAIGTSTGRPPLVQSAHLPVEWAISKNDVGDTTEIKVLNISAKRR